VFLDLQCLYLFVLLRVGPHLVQPFALLQEQAVERSLPVAEQDVLGQRAGRLRERGVHCKPGLQQVEFHLRHAECAAVPAWIVCIVGVASPFMGVLHARVVFFLRIIYIQFGFRFALFLGVEGSPVAQRDLAERGVEEPLDAVLVGVPAVREVE